MDALDKAEKSVSEKIKSAVTANTVMTYYLSPGFRKVGFTGLAFSLHHSVRFVMVSDELNQS